MNKIMSRDIVALLLISCINLYFFSIFFFYNHAKNMHVKVMSEKQSDEFNIIYNLSNNSENSKTLLPKENGQESLESFHDERHERHMSYGLDFELEYDSGNIKRTREVRSDPGERSLDSDCEASMILPLIDKNKKLSQGVLMIETSGENMRMSLTRKLIKCIRSIIPYSKTSMLNRISC